MGSPRIILFSFPNPAYSPLLTHSWGWHPCLAEVIRRFPCQVPQHTVSLGGVSVDAHLLAHLPHRPISKAFRNLFDRNGIPTFSSPGNSPPTVVSSFSPLLTEVWGLEDKMAMVWSVFNFSIPPPPKPMHMVSSIRIIAEDRIQSLVLPKGTVRSLRRREKNGSLPLGWVLSISTHLGMVVVLTWEINQGISHFSTRKQTIS